MLITSTIAGKAASKHSFRSQVGIRSYIDDFGDVARMTFLTSAFVAGRSSDNSSPLNLFSERRVLLLRVFGPRPSLIQSIFAVKWWAKLSAISEGLVWLGSNISLFREMS